MHKSEERKLFKDWFDIEAAYLLAEQFYATYPQFDTDRFVETACANLSKLEFYARIRQFAKALRQTLPAEVPDALNIIALSLPPIISGTESTSEGWLQWPVGQWLADYSLEYPDLALDVMLQLTQRFTSEFAVRPFVENYPEKTIAYLLKHTVHPSPHVRRWCSEGLRPRLPWGKVLEVIKLDPTPILPVLEALRDDVDRYVQRSVANCLNDIGKDHPDVLLDLCSQWQKGSNPQRTWIVRHALRSLVKQGNARALESLGSHLHTRSKQD
ncbi:MAG: DNA alkylation repair protein [Verrucomicrobia bacterium]|nr:DNA alkylation repair protein [Verrucomicrobiota bacterium]